ncbi:MAG: VWA domain-containing protein, partial [Candidatus Lokiarchaeota archaeon]|nr:VWA domain-containing protein [Candidatus Lokiarchaeota archaeon]MBD3200904.1 VWA domain-containing protein [Candidatus Lokiarchaeota archaeon]
NFPFTAILGQEKMKMALILNIIDPQIGGVLLTGHQGTGKSTSVRSLVDVMPQIEVVKGCQFSCNPNSSLDDLCSDCIEKRKADEIETERRDMRLVNLPLGVTEDMVCGSLSIDKVLTEGISELHPGLLAKANRGILYIDEINLLQDHIVDTLLDASASGVNIIEREGISIIHPAKFVLVGSMNPEEGELRPQIADRLGLEVKIEAPRDPQLRSEITRRVIEFNDNPKAFIKKYDQEQEKLGEKLVKARSILKDVEIPSTVYELVSKIVNELDIFSQRADITFIRCARAHAAFSNRREIKNIDLNVAMDLVFEHRIKSLHYEMTPEEIKGKIEEVYGKIKEAYEDTDIYQPNRENEGPLKHSDEPQEEFRRQPIDPDKVDIPETEEQKLPPPEEPDKEERKASPAGGWKVKNIPLEDEFKLSEKYYNSNPLIYQMEKKMVSILDNIRSDRKISQYGGRGIGRRIKVSSSQKGRYVSYRHPINDHPKSIALDATIRNYLKKAIYNQSQIDFPLHFEKQDIMDKIYEYRAPLALFFVLDSSASMYHVIKQMTDVILSLQREGYRKKDKISLIVFRGKEAVVLQKPTVSFNYAIQKLKNLEGKSYTPMAAGLKKCQELIKTEKLKNRNIIPIIFICSDCGANISVKHPDLIAQIESDYNLIVEELKDITKSLSRQNIHIVVLEPKKSYATQALGIHPYSADKIKKNFKKCGNAEIYQFDKYNSENLILKLKKIL